VGHLSRAGKLPPILYKIKAGLNPANFPDRGKFLRLAAVFPLESSFLDSEMGLRLSRVLPTDLFNRRGRGGFRRGSQSFPLRTFAKTSAPFALKMSLDF